MKLKNIEIKEGRDGLWRVRVNGQKVKGQGKSPAESLGNFFLDHREGFGLDIKTIPLPEEERRLISKPEQAKSELEEPVYDHSRGLCHMPVFPKEPLSTVCECCGSALKFEKDELVCPLCPALKPSGSEETQEVDVSNEDLGGE